MSTLTAPTVPVETREHYLNANYGIRSWLLTVDHKRIALLYLASITLFFFLGGFFAVLIRLELLTPQGDMVQAETYNKLFTHARDHHDLLLPDPGNPRRPGEFSGPADGRRERSGFSRA